MLHGSYQVNCLVISHLKTQVVCLLICSLHLACQSKLQMADLLQSCTLGWEQVSQAKPEKQKIFWSTMHKAKQLFGLQIQRDQVWGGWSTMGMNLFGYMG